MLPGKGNADDGNGKQEAKDQVHYCGVEPAAQKPYNIQQGGEATRIL